MKISVLMSVYNGGDPVHLQRALQSVWYDQTHKPSEIVLVEDGLLNESLRTVISEFKQDFRGQFKSVRIPENVGLASALNRGIEECCGDLIARMDADDISEPNRFKLQHEFFLQHSDIDVLGGALQEFNDECECLFIRRYPKDTDRAWHSIAKASPFAHPAVMFNRRVFDAGYRYNEELSTSQDIEMWFRLLADGRKFANLPEVLINFRIDQGFLQRRSRKKSFREFQIYWHGLRRLYGWNWRLFYPTLRLLFRISPSFLVRRMYSSKLRKKLNSH